MLWVVCYFIHMLSYSVHCTFKIIYLIENQSLNQNNERKKDSYTKCLHGARCTETVYFAHKFTIFFENEYMVCLRINIHDFHSLTYERARAHATVYFVYLLYTLNVQTIDYYCWRNIFMESICYLLCSNDMSEVTTSI